MTAPSSARATSFFTHLECSATGETAPWRALQGLSPAGRPWLPRYDLAAIRASVDRDAFAERPRGLWRWAELLPLPLDRQPVTLGEGDTPLLAAPRLAAELGLERLWIKDESTNPTGSFKARGMTAAVTMAAYLGARALIVPSAGNAGGALAAYAARAGLPAHVYVPNDTPEVNRREVVLYGARLVEIAGLIDDCGRAVAAERAQLGAFDVSTLKEPYRLEGKKTMGLELAEALGWRLPDVIVYPAGGGTGLVGMAKAFAELRELGFLPADARTRFVAVQAAGCAPVVRAFTQGDAEATRWEGAHTIASGLRVPAAVGDRLMLAALRDSGGTAVAIADPTLIADMVTLAALEGINAAPEAGACVAAVRELLARGTIAPSDEVVIFNTGAGTKYLEALRELPSATPRPA